MFITVTRDGSIFFDSDKLQPADLHNRVRDRLIQGAEPKIYFKVDSRARYGAAVEALDGIRSNGVRDIAFIVEDRREVEARRQQSSRPTTK